MKWVLERSQKKRFWVAVLYRLSTVSEHCEQFCNALQLIRLRGGADFAETQIAHPSRPNRNQPHGVSSAGSELGIEVR